MAESHRCSFEAGDDRSRSQPSGSEQWNGPVDRALLIAHGRRDGEETAQVAKRFGVSAATVRRLEAQLDGASSGEVAALRAGDLNLAVHAVIARRVTLSERAEVIGAVAPYGV